MLQFKNWYQIINQIKDNFRILVNDSWPGCHDGKIVKPLMQPCQQAQLCAHQQDYFVISQLSSIFGNNLYTILITIHLDVIRCRCNGRFCILVQIVLIRQVILIVTININQSTIVRILVKASILLPAKRSWSIFQIIINSYHLSRVRVYSSSFSIST